MGWGNGRTATGDPRQNEDHRSGSEGMNRRLTPRVSVRLGLLGNRLHARGLRALLTLRDLELDLLSFVEVLVSLAGDGAEVHEHIGATVIGSDEAVALLGAEPLHGPSRHTQSPPFLASGRYVCPSGTRWEPGRELLEANCDRCPREHHTRGGPPVNRANRPPADALERLRRAAGGRLRTGRDNDKRSNSG